MPTLPQDLFMIMRVVTLLRGVLASLRVDVSSALLWRPLALQVRHAVRVWGARRSGPCGRGPSDQGG